MSVQIYTKFDDVVLPFYRGDTETYTFTCYDDATLATLSNLTGYTISAQARKHADDSVTLFDTGATAGMAIANGTNGTVLASGVVVLLITAVVTATLPETCVYDIRAMAGAVVRRIASGRLVMRKSVTR